MKKKIRRGIAVLSAILTAAASLPALNTAAPRQEVSAADRQIVAFPGAVGGGKYATGGRGGSVYHVTNLNDSGEGSFRDAVSVSNRIVVFDVSGTIELKSNIICKGNITIAGQTAPGGSGITLKNYKMGMGGDNIICRFISSRPGPYASTSSGNDAWGGANGSGSIIDHCSMGWTTDEQWGLYSNNEYYTVQYSVLGPADSWGGHKKGLHGFGIMMGKGNLTFDHNLIIHNVSRNFRGKVQGTATADFTNNIIYDWGYQTAYGTIGHLNYVNNTLKAGNSTTGGYHWMNVDSSTSPTNFKVYCAGNRMLMKDGSLNSITYDNWAGVSLKSGLGITMDDLHSNTAFQTIVNGENISTAMTCESAEASYDHVLTYAGNGISSDKRTAVDKQCAAETRNGTGSCSGTSAYDATVTDLDKYQIQCGVTYTYPSPVLTKEITDNDNDGMDDAWELARGLNPNDPTDINDDYCGLGYTNIEYYINDLTVNAFPEGVVTPSPESSLEPISAFETIEAESFSSMNEVRTEEMSSGGQNIGFIQDGSWVMFRKVDFEDGAKNFSAVLSGNPSTIEIYVNQVSGSPVAKISFPGTNGFTDYQEMTFGIPSISGTHNLYLKFTGGEGYLLNLDHFVFGKEAIKMKGNLLTDIEVADSALPGAWNIGTGLKNGSLIFGDRNFTILDLPDELADGDILMTACDAKAANTTTATLKASKDIVLYLAFDTRVDAIPAWASEYTQTDLSFHSSNDVTFALYQKAYKAGDVITLGGNEQSNNCVNYTVIAVPDITAEVPTEPATDPATEPEETQPETEPSTETSTTEEETVPAESNTVSTEDNFVCGDVNEDTSVDIMDVIMLNKNLLGGCSLSDQGRKNADVNQDGKPDQNDSLSIMKYIVGLVDSLPV